MSRRPVGCVVAALDGVLPPRRVSKDQIKRTAEARFSFRKEITGDEPATAQAHARLAEVLFRKITDTDVQQWRERFGAEDATES
jgi:hypothetical protein